MRYRRAPSLILISAALVAFAVEEARGESNEPSTLLQWSYGKNSEVGSDLDKPLETDRPNFTESPKAVGRGVVQLETGYTFTYDAEGKVRTSDHSFPETLLRVGMLADWLEFRAGW